MQGIQFVVDESNNKVAVMIDLAMHGELWDDVYDAYLAAERANEPDESLESVKQHLREIGKLS
ncbi:MAG: hypothetical protein NTZ56_02375 [Acidobacteria bacterium]|nr:hypothetical protein [Acidobacteriota bacterium]